jgi:hypothetical protein
LQEKTEEEKNVVAEKPNKKRRDGWSTRLERKPDVGTCVTIGSPGVAGGWLLCCLGYGILLGYGIIIPYPWYGIALAYTHIYVCDFKSLKIIFYVITFHKFYRALFTYKK